MARAALALLLLPPVLVAAGPKTRPSGPVRTPQQAKAIAERETGGKALSARRVPLNGASGGWEVVVRGPGEDRTWRCLIDADTRQVVRRTALEPEDRRGRGEGPLQVVKGRG